MPRTKGSLNLSSNIEGNMGAPLDARSIAPTLADLTDSTNYPYSYIGMLVACQATSELYMLKAKPVTTMDNWIKIGSIDLSNYYTKAEVDAIVAKVYKPAGDKTAAQLVASLLSATNLGNVYNITTTGTTTSDFAEGEGHPINIGDNVVIVDLGSGTSHNYKFDMLPGFIDLSEYQTKLQVTSLPTASADENGKIYQYIGETTSSLTNGYFYKCVSDGEGGYEWVPKSVQPADTGGGELENSLTAGITVGGITAGDTFEAGTSMETLWNNLVNPTLYPTFTAPSATISVPGDKLLETGATASKTFTVAFNRGAITPSYGTSGYRAGAASGYSLNGGTVQSENTFTETVAAGNKTFQASVSYAAGEQPKDSKGNNYSDPLPAGSVNTNTITYEFVDAIWSNDSNITTIAKEALVSKSTKVKAFSFPASTVANPEVFDVPASWTVTTVEVLNTLSNQWETATSQFTVTDTTHNDAAGNSVNYKRYTCNLGMALGARQVRFKWS